MLQLAHSAPALSDPNLLIVMHVAISHTPFIYSAQEYSKRLIEHNSQPRSIPKISIAVYTKTFLPCTSSLGSGFGRFLVVLQSV